MKTVYSGHPIAQALLGGFFGYCYERSLKREAKAITPNWIPLRPHWAVGGFLASKSFLLNFVTFLVVETVMIPGTYYAYKPSKFNLLPQVNLINLLLWAGAGVVISYMTEGVFNDS